MHDDGPQIILPVPEISPGRVEARLRAAEAILAEAGFADGRAEDQTPTLLIQVAPADLVRLQDEALRERLAARLKALGFTYVAVDITPEDGDVPLTPA